MTAPALDWRKCPTCPPADNEWPATEFLPGMARCKACYYDQKHLAQELKVVAETPEERARIRKKRGICQECPNPVDGVVGKTLHCAACRQRRRRAKEKKHRRDPAVRERRAARRRELHAERMASDPEYAAAYRARRQRETLASSPGYDHRIEYFRKTNSGPVRAERKREWARARYYERHPERPQPVCATCSRPIAYTGKGKPPKYHPTEECNPWIRRDRRVA